MRWSPLQRSRVQTEAAPARQKTPQAGATGEAKARATPRQPRNTGPGSPAEGREPGGRERRRARSEPAASDVRRLPPGGLAASLEYFAPCPRGLEALLANELAGLGAAAIEPGRGGVAFRGERELAWRVNLWSRLAIRVLWRVGHGRYRDEDDLYRAALALPWPRWFALDRSIAVRTVAHQSPLRSLKFTTLKIKDAICDRFRQECEARPNVDAREPDVPVLAYLERDQYQLYIDLSGAPLNRRGHRLEPAAAPLNENLAAGLLILAGWNPNIPLLDPMMGGGTLLSEAAMLALDIAPGFKRHFAFERLSDFDRIAWVRLRKDAEAARRPATPLPIYGCDIDPAMVRATRINLKAAGVLDCVATDQADALDLYPPEPAGILVSNPPYGVRLEAERGFYRLLGDTLKQRFAGWTACFLSADPEFPKHIGLKARRRTPLYNGALDCRLYEYALVEGSMRTPQE